MDEQSRQVLGWLGRHTDSKPGEIGRGSVRVSTRALAKVSLYKANNGPARQPRARRKGTKVTFVGHAMTAATAMGTRYAFVPRSTPTYGDV